VLEQRLPGRFRRFAPDSWERGPGPRLFEDLLSFWHARSRSVVLARIHRSTGVCRELVAGTSARRLVGSEGKKLSKFGIEKRLRQIRDSELQRLRDRVLHRVRIPYRGHPWSRR